MWFQAAGCSQCELLLNLINNNFLIFLTENLPILNPYLPQNLKICDPILVNLLKMRPHYSHSSRENATPSSGTFPLASCKGVPPPPPREFSVRGPGGGVWSRLRDKECAWPCQKFPCHSSGEYNFSYCLWVILGTTLEGCSAETFHGAYMI